ncbi:MAG: hydrogenase maturation protease [Phycisphaerae bacterium]|nr:hydrogenase maturation protease [Phycisphaerae bacterium]
MDRVIRIICVGNRYSGDDNAGPLVHDQLAGMPLPAGVELVDGGLAGLNLLRFVDGAERVVFIDSVTYIQPGVVVLAGQDIAALKPSDYDHAGGLSYLLGVLPEVCDGQVPEVLIVGVAGDVDQEKLAAAAHTSIALAVEGAAGVRDCVPCDSPGGQV